MNLEELNNLLKNFVDEFKITGVRRVNAEIKVQNLRNALFALKGNSINHLSAITGVDGGDKIIVIYHIDCRNGVLLNLRLKLPKEDLKLPTVTDIFPGAVFYERDLMEMLGVKVEGHPDPRHLFLPDDWPPDTYPLRREFGARKPEKQEAS